MKTEKNQTETESYLLYVEMQIKMLDEDVRKDLEEIAVNPCNGLVWNAEHLYKKSYKSNYMKNLVKAVRDSENDPKEVVLTYKARLQNEMNSSELMNSTSMMRNCSTIWNLQILRDIQDEVELMIKHIG